MFVDLLTVDSEDLMLLVLLLVLLLLSFMAMLPLFRVIACRSMTF